MSPPRAGPHGHGRPPRGTVHALLSPLGSAPRRCSGGALRSCSCAWRRSTVYDDDLSRVSRCTRTYACAAILAWRVAARHGRVDVLKMARAVAPSNGVQPVPVRSHGNIVPGFPSRKMEGREGQAAREGPRKGRSWVGPSAGKLRRVVTRLSLTPAWPYRHAASTLRLAMRPLLGDRPVASATRFVRQAVRARVHRRATSVGGPPIRGATWKRRGSAGPRRRVTAGQDGSHRNAPVAGHSHSRQRAAAVRALMVRKGSPVRVRQRARRKGLDFAFPEPDGSAAACALASWAALGRVREVSAFTEGVEPVLIRRHGGSWRSRDSTPSSRLRDGLPRPKRTSCAALRGRTPQVWRADLGRRGRSRLPTRGHEARSARRWPSWSGCRRASSHT